MALGSKYRMHYGPAGMLEGSKSRSHSRLLSFYFPFLLLLEESIEMAPRARSLPPIRLAN